jgi:hypothetical protein
MEQMIGYLAGTLGFRPSLVHTRYLKGIPLGCTAIVTATIRGPGELSMYTLPVESRRLLTCCAQGGKVPSIELSMRVVLPAEIPDAELSAADRKKKLGKFQFKDTVAKVEAEPSGYGDRSAFSAGSFVGATATALLLPLDGKDSSKHGHKTCAECGADSLAPVKGSSKL